MSFPTVLPAPASPSVITVLFVFSYRNYERRALPAITPYLPGTVAQLLLDRQSYAMQELSVPWNGIMSVGLGDAERLRSVVGLLCVEHVDPDPWLRPDF